MGTRGFVGFIVSGKEKIAYNHYDSYPRWLGLRVMTWAGSVDLVAARKQAVALRVVTGKRRPTARHIDLLHPYMDKDLVDGRDEIDWYSLLRGTQGDPEAILACGYVEDAVSFATDSLFAEWGYLVNFDTGQLETYRGSQEQPHHDGRFAGRTPFREGYWPVGLVASFPLDQPDSDAMCALEDTLTAVSRGPC
jgi:hypothetical protein